MGLEEIQRLADALGIPCADRQDAGAIIKAIQMEEGLMPCFSEAWSVPCRIGDCPFSAICSSNASISLAAKH